MSDIRDVVDAEVEANKPDDQPEFDTLLARRSGRPRGRSRWVTAGAAVVVAVVATVTALVGPRLLDSPPVVDPVALDTYQPSDVAFFGRLHMYTSPVLTETYDNVNVAAQSASVTVVAEVADVRLSHWVGPTNDRLPTMVVLIHPAEVLVGQLPDDFAKEIPVLFPADESDPNGAIEALRSSLPERQSVWFLRSLEEEVAKAEKYQENTGQTVPDYAREIQETERKMYRLVSPDGLLLQGEQEIITPLPIDEVDGSDLSGNLPANAASFTRLSELVEHLRTVDGWRGKRPQFQGP